MAPAAERLPSGRFGLAKGPLGIVLATLFLVEAVMGLVVSSPDLAPADASFLIRAMVGLALVALCGFFVVWIWFPKHLYPPDQFRDERNWLYAVMGRSLVASDPLPLSIPVKKPHEAANNVLVEPLGRVQLPEIQDRQLLEMAIEMQAGDVTPTLIMDLTNHLLQRASNWDYLIIDVGEDNTWLLSRLYIFVSVHRALRNLPCIVFVRTEAANQKLLGIADPLRVCSILAKLYPWFYETLADILTKEKIPIFDPGALDEAAAIEVVTEFVHLLQTTDDRTGDPEWSKLWSESWEHTQWLSTELVGGDLASAMFDPKAAFFKRPEGMSDIEFAIEIVRRDSPFVAVVGEQGEFRELYDKQRLFEKVKNRLVEPLIGIRKVPSGS